MPGNKSVLSVRPLAISAGAVELLARGGVPRLSVAHRHGVSLSVSGVDEDIFLGAPGRGLFPLHIVVRERDMWRVLDTAETSPGRAAVGHAPLALQIDTVGVRVFHSCLTPDPAGMHSESAKANMAALAQCLRSIPDPLGLGMRAGELLARDSMLLRRVSALQEGSPDGEEAMLALLGRGTGSTPAGDDMIIGVLAHAWATVGKDSPVASLLRTMDGRLPQLTTAASVSYLRAAARGEFGSHLTGLVRNIAHVRCDRALALAARVANHGVTSGMDVLVGFVAAAEAG